MYEIKEIILTNGPVKKKRYSIQFSDSKQQIIGEFLMSDATLLGAKVVHELEAVIAGVKDRVEFSGNRCHVTIERTNTILEDLYVDVEGFDVYPAYKINTKSLLDLVNMWLAKVSN